MFCQECKVKRAEIEVMKKDDKGEEQIKVCKECASKISKKTYNEQLSFGVFLKEILNEKITNKMIEHSDGMPTCKHCGTTLLKIREIAEFGCPKCYKSFEPYLDDIFKDLHGGVRHAGKVPKIARKDVAKTRKVHKLKQLISKYVEEENYEMAAQVRDELKKSQKEVKDD